MATDSFRGILIVDNIFDLRGTRKFAGKLLTSVVFALASGACQAAITSNPISLAFYQPTFGTALNQVVTVTNSSGVAVTFNSPQVIPASQFTIGTLSTCFTGIVPNGGSCTVSIGTQPQTSAGAFSGVFYMSTPQFPALQAGLTDLFLTVTTGTTLPATNGQTLTAVSPQQLGLSPGYSSRMLSYSLTGSGAVTPVAGFLCTQLTGGVPPNGVSASPPCSLGSQSTNFPLQSTGLQVQRGNGYARAYETISFSDAVFRLALSQAKAIPSSALYFVRQFSGGQYAVVQLSAVGSSMADPLTLTDVHMGFLTGGARRPTVSLLPGQTAPPAIAEISYNGSGTLRGRWEVVEPGESLPASDDLVPEASVPFASRGLQRRYRQIERFEVVLGPGGRYDLHGPDPVRLPVRIPGIYFLLLRIEAVPALQLGMPAGAEHGAAGFSMPVLVYQVGTGIDATSALADRVIRILPTSVQSNGNSTLSWVAPAADIRAYRVEIVDASGVFLGAKYLLGSQTVYSLAGTLQLQLGVRAARWRVVAYDDGLRPVGRSEWIDIRSAATGR